MKISGGIRFLPIFGLSGCGKTSAAFELSAHIPDCKVVRLTREQIESSEALTKSIAEEKTWQRERDSELLICIIDQYEEFIAEKAAIPKRFVETLSLFDRGDLRKYPTLFLWLTTSRDFQKLLSDATTRNRRILVSDSFELQGPPRSEWPVIVEETFSFHNQGKTLADLNILRQDIEVLSKESDTVGATVQAVGNALLKNLPGLIDLSDHQVMMLWPVTEGKRLANVTKFTDARSGYTLDWNAWYNQFNSDDKKTLPFHEYNRARLYYQMRLVPIAAADLMLLCKDPDNAAFQPTKTALERFEKTHFVKLLKDQWEPDAYTTLRERTTSTRADNAKQWYSTATERPSLVGQRIALALQLLGFNARTEAEIKTPFSVVKADILVTKSTAQRKRLIELKVFSPTNTTISGIRDALRTTLKKYAQLSGYLKKT